MNKINSMSCKSCCNSLVNCGNQGIYCPIKGRNMQDFEICEFWDVNFRNPVAELIPAIHPLNEKLANDIFNTKKYVILLSKNKFFLKVYIKPDNRKGATQ